MSEEIIVNNENVISDVINNIVEAEKSADEIVKNSQISAKDIVAKAKEDASTMVDKAKIAIEQEKAVKAHEAEYVVDRKTQQTLEDCNKKIEEMKKQAMSKSDKAIEFVVRSIATKYDC